MSYDLTRAMLAPTLTITKRAIDRNSLGSSSIALISATQDVYGKLMKSLAPTSPSPPSMHPYLIASGLGLASREELAGLCALLETVSLAGVAVGVGANLLQRIGAEIETAAARVQSAAAIIQSSDIPDDVLRHRLWHGLANGLGTGSSLPLSERRLAQAAAALGVMASQILSPNLRAADELQCRLDAGRDTYRRRIEDKMRAIYNDPKSVWQSSPPLSFPEIVARQLASMLDTIDVGENQGAFDPDIARAMQKGGKQAWAGVAAGGGWVGLAAAVNGAGFAPYILAAQASAFIPFMGGPAVVSLLAVLVNPVTIMAGLVALGGFGGNRLNKTIKAQISASIVVLLAMRGLADPSAGLGRSSTAFRHLSAAGQRKPEYLKMPEWTAMKSLTARVEAEIGRRMPDAPGREPENWGTAPEISIHNTSSGETEAIVGLTAAEMLYHAMSIDPRVLAAADFWRTADLSNQIEFATHATEFAVHGADIALRGFTAEQMVLGNLLAKGHHVTLPDSSANPGFDLIVDGQEVQVKCGEGLSLLSEHFEKYPDIPVIANAELVGLISDQPWAELVTALEGFELGIVEDITASSVAAGIELASIDAMATAIGAGAIRGAFAVLKGEIPAGALPAWLVVDTALRGTLVTVGSKAGAVLGLVTIGPAGALVLGPIMGASTLFGLDGAKAMIDGRINKAWYDEMLAASEALRVVAQRDLKARIALLVHRRDSIFRPNRRLPDDLTIWLDQRAAEDAIAASEDLMDLDAQVKTVVEAMCLDVLAARSTPASPDVLRARRLLQNILSHKPGPLDGSKGRLEGLWQRGKGFARF